jgi:hypothetical protein
VRGCAHRCEAMKPVTVDVITYAPTVFLHCQHCELTFQEMGLGERLRREEAADALPDDLARDYQALSDWVHSLLERHGRGLRVRVIDAASIEGFFASLRHRVARYPAVVVDGTDKRVGADFAALDELIDKRIAAGDGVTP